MNQFTDFLAYVLSAVGVTVLVVWPENGPVAFVRERVLRRLLPGPAKSVLDCYVCLGFWSGLFLSPLWWLWCGEYWCWTGCLVTPAVFWLALPKPPLASEEDEKQ